MDTTTQSSGQQSTSTTGVAVGTIVSSGATPYGYTVSIWSSGALLMHWHSSPGGVGGLPLRRGRAVVGFGLIGLIAHGRMWAKGTLQHGPQRVLAGVLHWFSVGLAVGAVALVSMIHSWAAWPLGSFIGTAIYRLGASVQLSLVARRNS